MRTYPSQTNMDRELLLRKHIRKHLLDYCLAHLTTDYKTYTEDAVTSLLSQSLALVPITDMHSLTLPSDPLDVILNSIPTDLAIEEKWSTEADAVKHLRNTLTVPDGKLKSQMCWEEEDDDVLEYFLPMSPVLTRRAVLETPRFGSLSIDNTPRSLFGALDASSIGPLTVEDIQDPPILSVEDASDINFTVESTTQSEIVALLKEAVYSTSSHSSSSSHTETFLRLLSPPMQFVDLESLPIFPRSRQPGIDSGSSELSLRALQNTSDLPSILPHVKIEDDEDAYMEHMVVVDGWHTYAPISSPSPTPSLREGDSSSQIDELFLPSPPDNLPSVLDFESAKMDEVQIPRLNKIGQIFPQGEYKSFSGFFSSRLPTSKVFSSNSGVMMTPKSQPSSPHRNQPEIELSMLGQPPSTIDISDRDQQDVGKNPDFDLIRVYKEIKNDDFADIILASGLDTKDGMLMNVPELPPPTFHSTRMFLPETMRSLVASTSDATSKNVADAQCLRTVKGIKSLNLELSWIPFKFQKQFPTNEEGAGVSHGPYIEPVQKESIDELLEQTFAEPDHGMQTAHSAFDDSTKADEGLIFDILANDNLHVMDIIFTREERLNIAGVGSGIFEGESIDLAYSEDDERLAGGYLPEIDGAKKISEYEDRNRRFSEVDPLQLQNVMVDDCDYGYSPSLIRSVAGRDHGDMDDDDFMSAQPPVKRAKFDYEDAWISTEDALLQEKNFHEDSGVEFGYNQQYEPDDDLEPFDVEGTQALNIQQDCQMFELTQDSRTDADGFYPLSFNSTQLLLANRSDLEPKDCDAEDQSNRVAEVQDRLSIHNPDPDTATVKSQPQGPEVLSEQLPYKSSRQDFEEFLKLRGKNFTTTVQVEPPLPIVDVAAQSVSLPPRVPEDIFDKNTLRLGNPPTIQCSVHQYLASFDCIQKRALVRCLASQECAIDLIERDILDGVDLILDHKTAILLVSLATVPSECEALCVKISDLSWRFEHLLIIFEAFPAARSYASSALEKKTEYFAFSPPVVKAIRKLRRGLGIAEGSGVKKVESKVMWAFADDVGEVARLARLFGDAAEGRDETGGVIWQARDWLTQGEGDEFDGEHDLAAVEGLNTFFACVILSQVTLEEFIDMSPDSKVNNFGGILGVERMMRLNAIIQQRHQAMLSSSPLPASDFQDSLSGNDGATL